VIWLFQSLPTHFGRPVLRSCPRPRPRVFFLCRRGAVEGLARLCLAAIRAGLHTRDTGLIEPLSECGSAPVLLGCVLLVVVHRRLAIIVNPHTPQRSTLKSPVLNVLVCHLKAWQRRLLGKGLPLPLKLRLQKAGKGVGGRTVSVACWEWSGDKPTSLVTGAL